MSDKFVSAIAVAQLPLIDHCYAPAFLCDVMYSSVRPSRDRRNMAENSLRDECNTTHLVIDKCEYCGISEKLKVCGRCKSIYYCSKGHQQADWSRHKKICKKLLSNSRLQDQSQESMGVVVNHIENLRLQTRMENVTSADERDVNYNEENKSDIIKRDLHSAQETKTPELNREFGRKDIGSSEIFILESEESVLKPPSYTHSPNTDLSNSDDMPNEIRHTNQTYFSVVESRNKALGEYVTNCLNSYGVCVIDNFLGDSKAGNIWEEVNVLYKNRALSSGQLVNMVSPKGTVRGDLITWVDGSESGCLDVNFLISSIDAIMLHCQKRLDRYTVKGRSKV